MVKFIKKMNKIRVQGELHKFGPLKYFYSFDLNASLVIYEYVKNFTKTLGIFHKT